jgi:hypothetical protein
MIVIGKRSFYVCMILLTGIAYKDLENREEKVHRTFISDNSGMYEGVLISP